VTTTEPAAKQTNPPPPPRLLSLDAFRGFVIVVMFFVNVLGRDIAPQWIAHQGWNAGNHGNGLADYVFPWFLFIVGVAIPFSMSSGRGKALPAWRKILVALQRGATIYLLGTLIWCATIAYDKPITSNVLLHWDILPLIGLGYFIAVVMHHLPMWARATFVALVLLGKWALLTQIPHPDTGTVVWEQKLNAQAWLRDQLGWWGTLITQGLPAAATVVLGQFAGEILKRESWLPTKRARILATTGAAVTLASYAWHHLDMPYSKDFFTSSYVLVSAGTGAVLLALCYFIIDIKKITTMEFLRVFGLNAIAVYFLAEFLWKVALMRWNVASPGGSSTLLITAIKAWLQWPIEKIAPAIASEFGAIARMLVYITFYWLIARALYARKIFIKV
jgi:predicted acyltransferase